MFTVHNKVEFLSWSCWMLTPPHAANDIIISTETSCNSVVSVPPFLYWRWGIVSLIFHTSYMYVIKPELTYTKPTSWLSSSRFNDLRGPVFPFMFVRTEIFCHSKMVMVTKQRNTTKNALLVLYCSSVLQEKAFLTNKWLIFRLDKQLLDQATTDLLRLASVCSIWCPLLFVGTFWGQQSHLSHCRSDAFRLLCNRVSP